MDSNRLPGKALLLIGGKTSLSIVIESCKESEIPTVVATTSRTVDNEIEKISKECGVPCYRYNGNANSVLERFIWVAESRKLSDNDVIVRVTADCIGLEPGTIHEVLSNMTTEYAYASPQQGYPHGYGCEAFTFSALKSALVSSSEYVREHVTPYIQENYKWSEWKTTKYNMELNTQEDYIRIKEMYDKTM